MSKKAVKKNNKIKKIKDSLEKTQAIQVVKRITESRVKQNQHLYTEKNNPYVRPLNEDLSKTKQQKFNFESNDLEDEMDKSFLDKKRKKIPKQKVIIKKVYPKFLITFLILIIIITLSYIGYHFTTFNHHKVKIVEKKVKQKTILFAGDSITDFYDLSKYYDTDTNYIINSGVSGSKTTDILDHIDRYILQYKADKIFLLIGTNDLTTDETNDDIFDNIKTISEKIKEENKDSKLYIESIYPINDTDDDKISHKMVNSRDNTRIKEINDKLKEYCNSNKIEYIDMYDILKDDDDNLKLEYTKEGLHISDEGYKIITKTLKTYIKQ